jgi:hypothetical protein
MQKVRLVRRASEVLLSLVVLALFSGVGFLNFYRTNFESLEGPWRILRWYCVVLAIAIAGSVVAKAIFRPFPIHRIFLIAAALCFMAFSYDEIKMLVSHDGVRALIGDDHFALFSILCWAVVTVAIGMLVGIFSKQAVLMPTMALVGIVYVVPATMSLARALAHPVVMNDPKALALTARREPNVYWIVLDGYPRRDVLQEFFDFDNGAFVERLKGLNFTVYDRAAASFPETAFSISSTLSMGFLLDRAAPSPRIPPLAELQRTVRGQNVVVNTFRAMGYRYVHFQNGYDNLTECPLEGAICIKGNVQSIGSAIQFDEFNIAVLSRTPMMDLIAMFTDADRSIENSMFLRGAVHEVTDRLSQLPEGGAPFFLYAHILAPHPPIRFKRDCSVRSAAPDLLDWNAADKSAFIDQLICVNNEAVTLLDKVIEKDPQAIIVLQSDHGTAFRGQFKKPFDDWDAADLKERFGALNALRMPDVCSDDTRGTVDLVNTFARVLNCVSDSHLPDKGARQFVVSHADMRTVHEYTADTE